MATDRKDTIEKVIRIAEKLGGGVAVLDYRRLRPEAAKRGFAIEVSGIIVDGVGTAAKGRLIWIPDNANAQEG